MIAGLRTRRGAEAGELTVASAGIRGPAGRPMQQHAAEELRSRGVSPRGFVSRVLTDLDLGRARLVLTATRDQRDALISAAPVVMRTKTFTWRELSWLLAGAGPGDLPDADLSARVTALAEFAQGRRGLRTPPDPSMLDVADPMGGPRRDYKTAAADIDAAVDAILQVMAG